MTDKDRFVSLLQEWEVPFTKSRRTFKGIETYDITVEADSQWGKGEDSKVVGYGSFFTTFEFHTDGRFRRIGIWE